MLRKTILAAHLIALILIYLDFRSDILFEKIKIQIYGRNFEKRIKPVRSRQEYKYDIIFFFYFQGNKIEEYLISKMKLHIKGKIKFFY